MHILCSAPSAALLSRFTWKNIGHSFSNVSEIVLDSTVYNSTLYRNTSGVIDQELDNDTETPYVTILGFLFKRESKRKAFCCVQTPFTQ
jgi:hypothetical protein